MAVFPVLAMAFYKWGFSMLGQSFPLQLQLIDPVKKQPILFYFLNLGLAFFAIPGIWFWKKFNRPVVILAVLALLVMTFVTAMDWGSDVAVKIGYPAVLALSLMAGYLLSLLTNRPVIHKLAVVLVLTACIPGSVTPVMEILNFTDVHNPRYRSLIEPMDMKAYKWIRSNTAPNSIIQKGPKSNILNAPYSAIPTFAHRHTYCGDWMHAHIFLIPEDGFKIREEAVNLMFTSKDPGEVYKLCSIKGIDYLFWGCKESRFFGIPDHLIKDKSRFSMIYRHISSGQGVYLFELLGENKF